MGVKPFYLVNPAIAEKIYIQIYLPSQLKAPKKPLNQQSPLQGCRWRSINNSRNKFMLPNKINPSNDAAFSFNHDCI